MAIYVHNYRNAYELVCGTFLEQTGFCFNWQLTSKSCTINKNY